MVETTKLQETNIREGKYRIRKVNYKCFLAKHFENQIKEYLEE